jgi:hypothetical protein
MEHGDKFHALWIPVISGEEWSASHFSCIILQRITPLHTKYEAGWIQRCVRNSFAWAWSN